MNKIRLVNSVLLCLVCLNANAANINFSNASISLIEVKSTAGGALLIMTLNDSSGNPIPKFCDANTTTPHILALELSDPAAHSILSIALMAAAANRTVSGWGLDALQGGYCGIFNLAIYP